MPELPEIEHLKRTLDPRIVGGEVKGVCLKRPDVLRSCVSHSEARIRRQLLLGQKITSLRRHGKQLAMIGESGCIICVHLGMSGQLRFVPARVRLDRPNHVHCVWRIEGSISGRLVFRDPRRFGGLWTFGSMDRLVTDRWSRLGPDALTIRAAALRSMGRSSRPIKAALLDQSMIAGVGNIYADEALFIAGIHPETPSNALDSDGAVLLARAIRAVLRRAIKAGGSTLRDYADANGDAGWFRVQHAVYGRSAQACRHCGQILVGTVVTQRTTVFCPCCQPLRPNGCGSIHIEPKGCGQPN